MPCEDYPCCGHEPGDCPDSQVTLRSLADVCDCPMCQRRADDGTESGGDFDYSMNG
jgi:hypothetical protein